MTSTLQRANTWLEARLGWLVLLVAVAGFLLRLNRATDAYYNGDESAIMIPPLQAGIVKVWRAALAYPTGPLGNLILYGLTFLGDAEWLFRMPSVIAGSLLPLVVFRWVGETFDRTAGFAAACFLAFAPNLIHLSAELRHYALQNLCMAASLLFLERAFRERSLKWLRWYGVAQALALLTMYMSIWYILGIAIYALLRMRVERVPGRFLVEWAAAQVVSATICVVAYFTHLVYLQGSQGEVFARDQWLRTSYFHPESQNVLAFVFRSTGSLLAYAAANLYLAIPLGILFLIGLGVAWRGQPDRRRLATFSLVLPFVTTAAAAIVRLYPYGGSRHDSFLVVFLAAGAGLAVAFLLRHRAAVLFAAALVFLPLWKVSAQRSPLHGDPKFERVTQMRDALSYFSNLAPKPSVVVLDQISSLTFLVYVCHGRFEDWRDLSSSQGPSLSFYRCGGYQALQVQEWWVAESTLASELAKARTASPGLLRGPAWYFHIDMGIGDVFQPPRAEEAWFGQIHVGKSAD